MWADRKVTETDKFNGRQQFKKNQVDDDEDDGDDDDLIGVSIIKTQPFYCMCMLGNKAYHVFGPKTIFKGYKSPFHIVSYSRG